MEEKSIAYEMLEELKTNSRRWFKIAMAELLVIFIIVVSFFIYESQYEYATTTEETYTQETFDNDSSDITQTIN